MYFDFDGRYNDYTPVGGGLRRWDGVVLSVVVHAVLVVVALFISTLDLFDRSQRIAEIEQKLAEERRERPQFVFVQPRVDLKALNPPPRAEASDIDRKANRGLAT